jgi:uncharacterized sporulation protein YeaH/YhbH (DUF444 family)
MLTANQFHKQSGIQIEFQDFLQKMKTSFGENFMDKVNQGKVKLQEAQQALGLEVTKTKDQKIANRKNIRVRKVNPQTKAATGLKCSSCEEGKNGDQKSTKNVSKSVRNIALLLGISAVVVWAIKNRK